MLSNLFQFDIQQIASVVFLFFDFFTFFPSLTSGPAVIGLVGHGALLDLHGREEGLVQKVRRKFVFQNLFEKLLLVPHILYH